MTYVNVSPDPVFRTLDELRREMTRTSPQGAAFLDYLCEGDYFAGKQVWINPRAEISAFYEELLRHSPELASESPYGTYFRTKVVRQQGENKILLCSIADAPAAQRAQMREHQERRRAGFAPPSLVFAGGPAAKMAAIIAASEPAAARGVHFVLDGAEQSNESGSASYEHVNHANALNAEHDNTGAGILLSALGRALRGEPDPSVALDYDYRKVDLWPHAIKLRDLPIYAGNEIHGWVQRFKSFTAAANDHTKSRLASKQSTEILSHIEQRHGCALRLDNSVKRAIFLYFTEKNYRLSLKDNAELRESVGLRPQSLTKEQLEFFYGEGFPARVYAGDLFPENACVRHGLDGVCREVIERLGARYLLRHRIRRIYLDASEDGRILARGVEVEDFAAGNVSCIPLDHLGLSLGPTATYRYAEGGGLGAWLKDALGIGKAVPHQTIATGMSAQVLFRITDHKKAAVLPFTGMKQTHFVEIGRTGDRVLMKLTCGGTIGLPVYSRSYGISAIASMLRVITPALGLQFEDVVCAWPCTRGVNPSNNGQAVRLADNAACRFGEGGTGMSKMGTNAQTLLDLTGAAWPLPQTLRIPPQHYAHTVLDRRVRIRRRLLG
jgi:hypothetical protein